MTNIDLHEYFTNELNEHQVVARATQEALRAAFCQLVEQAEISVRSGGKLLFFGNGGSAADAQHLATELTVRYRDDRVPIAALALTTDTSALTAISNDFNFDQIFSRQLRALGKPGDLAIGISTSGISANVIEGLKTAREMGLIAAAFTGAGGGRLIGLADPILAIPSRTTARIQEMHITLGQMLCGALERTLGLVAS